LLDGYGMHGWRKVHADRTDTHLRKWICFSYISSWNICVPQLLLLAHILCFTPLCLGNANQPTYFQSASGTSASLFLQCSPQCAHDLFQTSMALQSLTCSAYSVCALGLALMMKFTGDRS
jgi:hypothetical protein